LFSEGSSTIRRRRGYEKGARGNVAFSVHKRGRSIVGGGEKLRGLRSAHFSLEASGKVLRTRVAGGKKAVIRTSLRLASKKGKIKRGEVPKGRLGARSCPSRQGETVGVVRKVCWVELFLFSEVRKMRNPDCHGKRLVVFPLLLEDWKKEKTLGDQRERLSHPYYNKN